MTTERAASPTSTEYFSARSRTDSTESRRSSTSRGRRAELAPLSGDGRRQIGVSCNAKRQFKDRRIYVNPRTGLPVRPPTSFGLFKHALRRSIGNKVSFADFNRKAIEAWAKMTEEEKEPYGQRARELADHFKQIEVRFLRKKVRQLQRHVKEYRQCISTASRQTDRRANARTN